MAAQHRGAAVHWTFGLIVFPVGVGQGVLAVAFPFLAARGGMSLAMIGAIVGLGLFAIPLKLLWTPLVDLWLSLRTWVLLGMIATAGLLGALFFIPLTPDRVVLVSVMVLAGQIAATVVGIAGAGLMALSTPPADTCRVAGYWQAGALVAHGLCGGAALWLAERFGSAPAAVAVAVFCVPALAVLLVPEPDRPHLLERLSGRLAAVGRDLWSVARNPRGLYVVLAFCTPIGAGGASMVWSGIAGEWGAAPATVALTTGLGFAGATALGSFAFGFSANRMDRISAFLLASLLLIVTAILLAVAPRTPAAFVGGVLIYGVALGCAFTAFTALSLEVVGGGVAASKFGVLNALGNLGVAYMPPLLGWAHDRWSTTAMFWLEALLTLAFVIVFALLRPRGRSVATVAAPA